MPLIFSKCHRHLARLYVSTFIQHLVLCVDIYQQVSRESFTCPKCKVLTETALHREKVKSVYCSTTGTFCTSLGECRKFQLNS